MGGEGTCNEVEPMWEGKAFLRGEAHAEVGTRRVMVLGVEHCGNMGMERHRVMAFMQRLTWQAGDGSKADVALGVVANGWQVMEA